MAITPELVTAIGGGIGAIIAAFSGGKLGGANSLNGFKEEVRENFKGVHGKLDVLEDRGVRHDVRIEDLEKLRHECPCLRQEQEVP